MVNAPSERKSVRELIRSSSEGQISNLNLKTLQCFIDWFYWVTGAVGHFNWRFWSLGSY